MDFYRHLLLTDGPEKTISFFQIYLISTIFSFQTLLTAYIGSSYMERFVDEESVGTIFAIGSLGAISFIYFSSRILRSVGNVRYVIATMVTIASLLIIIGLAPTPAIAVVAFTLFLMINPQIYLAIDIFLETLIGDDEASTGSKRGLILTFMGVAAFLAPLTMGYLIGETDNMPLVFFTAAGIGLIFSLIVLVGFRGFKDPQYRTVKLKDMLLSLSGNTSIKIVLYCQFLLQLFFTWMVIYFPLYLATEVGMDWDSIGKIIAAGLFAYVIFEYPTGRLADQKLGEKELMALGLVILAISSSFISFLEGVTITTWMMLIFVSRIGASMLEITTESYFFKQVKGGDPSLISLFRLTRPIANLLGALIGSFTLLFLPFNLIFVVLGLILVTGAFATIKLVDTK
ncbi:MAG: MFS transporter [Candidatus Paceibacterota bacterium]